MSDSQPKRVAIPLAQQLPNENYAAQNPYNVYQTVQQPQAAQNFYQNYQPLRLQQQIQQPQTTSFGSSYSTNYQTGTANNLRPQQYEFVQQQQQQPVSLFQQQQLLPQPKTSSVFNIPPQQQPQPQTYFGQQPAPAQATPFNIFQSQGSPFINPFQPFLQQSLQVKFFLFFINIFKIL